MERNRDWQFNAIDRDTVRFINPRFAAPLLQLLGKIPEFQKRDIWPSIAGTAVMAARTGGRNSGVCIGRFRKFCRASGLGLFRKTKEK
jgi:hypothetical protein